MLSVLKSAQVMWPFLFIPVSLGAWTFLCLEFSASRVSPFLAFVPPPLFLPPSSPLYFVLNSSQFTLIKVFLDSVLKMIFQDAVHLSGSHGPFSVRFTLLVYVRHYCFLSSSCPMSSKGQVLVSPSFLFCYVPGLWGDWPWLTLKVSLYNRLIPRQAQ